MLRYASRYHLFFWGLLLILLLNNACSTSRSARTSRDQPAIPPAKVDKSQPDVADTGKDSLGTDAGVPPADSAGIAEQPGMKDSVALGYRQQYNVVIALPFLKNRIGNSGKDLMAISRWSLNFYGGAKMALQKLDRENIKLNVTILDTEASTFQTEKMINENQDLANANLIIGPYRRDNIQLLAEFARQKKIPLVSPYSASSQMTQDNPFYLQVRPSLETHCQVLLQHALKHYRPEQILLIGPEQDIVRTSFSSIQKENQRLAGTSAAKPLKEYLVDDATVDLQELDLSSFLLNQDTIALIVPAWTPRDEIFVYSLLRKLDVSRLPEQHVAVYGTPVWVDYSRIDLDYYEKLNVRISNYLYLPQDNEQLRRFNRDFYDRYGTLASEPSFLGHDVMLFFGQALKQYGVAFQDKILPSSQLIHTRFDFEPVVIPTTTGAEKNRIEQYENKFLYILKFQDYYFQLVD